MIIGIIEIGRDKKLWKQCYDVLKRMLYLAEEGYQIDEKDMNWIEKVIKAIEESEGE